ncbi:MAG: PAS domain-containing protein [Nitrospirae bacterium]|nr:MAG: PAS domain-containing protein [Nitrospirota bacterium]
MKSSLKLKILVPTVLVIVLISIVSVYLFNVGHKRSIERELTARGNALSYSLANAAEDGIVQENLDLLKKATYIINAEDVVLTQVYSSHWDAIDAFPFDRFRERPHEDALRHFKDKRSPMHVKFNSTYDFYRPIFFKTGEQTESVVIGFVRISLSASNMHQRLRTVVFTNIIVAFFMTLFAVLAISVLINKVILSRIARLHNRIDLFKKEIVPETPGDDQDDEIGRVLDEFRNMSIEVKNKKDMLAESKKRLSELFDRVEHSIFRTDTSGRIIEANKRFKAIFGNVSDICEIFTDPEHCVLRDLSDRIQHAEERAIGRNGKELTVLVSVYTNMDDAGNVKGFDGFLIDITEQKRLEDALRHTQKMEAVGTLAGGIAHDFNNIMQAILGYSSLIKNKFSVTDPVYSQLEIIERSAKRAAELTGQLLGFARGGKYVIEAVNLNELVDDTLTVFLRNISGGIYVRPVKGVNLRPVEADKMQLGQVIMQLCMNAADAMPSGGTLTVETFNFDGKPPLHSAVTGSYVAVKVSDTGMGMDRRIQQRIFEPFFTTKEIGKGTGMGLAMVYGVVKNHGGFIIVESEPNEGAVFTIYLPAA